MAEQINPFKMAQEQFDHVAKLLKLDSAVSEVLRWPMREYSFRIPVRMDNGSTRIYQGFRRPTQRRAVPNKGGIRFAANETLDTVRAGNMDDVEMRGGGYSAGRRQRRCCR